VLEIQDLQNEVGRAHSLRLATLRNPWRAVLLFIGVVAGFCGAVILSTLFAHPAGAASLPAPSGTLPGQAVSQSVVSTVTAIQTSTENTVSEITPPVVAPAAPAVNAVGAVATAVHTVVPAGNSDLQLAQQALPPVIGAAVPSTTDVLTPVVAALNPVVAPLDSVVAPGAEVALSVQAGPSYTVRPMPMLTSTHTGATSRSSAAVQAFEVSPAAPMRHPAPSAPAPQVPVAPGGASSGSSSPSSGSSPLAGHPAPGPLMPAPMVAGHASGRQQCPRLLLDLRSSPPG
jgi:hypothetical protein